ncbi:MAG: MFS transporter [Gammaproteobacteria bacterium]|nr:MFS transporter [Gammaproteobacteria bacterium]
MSQAPPKILPVIVFAQFAGTSLWFAGNAVVNDLQQLVGADNDVTGAITLAVQLGFILGTLLFAVLSISDRFSPSKVFLISAMLAAVFNIGIYWFASSIVSVLLFRFLTGFFLAGIYPVGMKIASDWYQSRLGGALGFLVGALVLGTAFPHILSAFPDSLSWQSILFTTSALSVSGGVILYLTVGDGPHRVPAPGFSFGAIPKIFGFRDFRSAACGYFGHMWELYAFWAFVPAILTTYNRLHGTSIDVSFWSFVTIGVGAISCVAGGFISKSKGSVSVAFCMLLVSGLFCFVSPILFHLPQWLFLCGLVIWGFAVVGDSPQFSAVVAKTAPKMYLGTALTIVNGIGFALTLVSIQLLVILFESLPAQWIYIALLPGPLFGLISIERLRGEL